MIRDAGLSDLAEVLEKVRATGSKKEKVSLLAGYLKGLEPKDAEFATRLSVGRSSERGSVDEARVGYSTLVEVILDLTGKGRSQLSAAYLKRGDLGEVAQEFLSEKRAQPLFEARLSLDDVKSAFETLRSAKGKGSLELRKKVVESLFLRASPVEAKYIVKVLRGEMRTGVVDGLIEEAIGAAYSVPKAMAARAHMAIGDIGSLARAAASGELGEVRLRPFHPVNFMLAEPLSTAQEVAAHFTTEAYAEYKYDGIRAQVHRLDGLVRIFSRRLEDITSSFPEVEGMFKADGRDFILDGEIVPFAEGRPLPFQLLQRRLRRQKSFEQAAEKAPVMYFAFDALLLGGDELVDMPLKERRAALLEVVCRSGAELAHSDLVESAEDVSDSFRRSRGLGFEGLVVKDPESRYSMGRRGSGWVKMKEELDTIDAVIVAAEYGNGKRAGVISDYTFAVRDGGELKTIGKAYSGLTDAEIGEMTRKLKESTVKNQRYRMVVRPEIVIEVAFDSIQRSNRHDSGYALRFPRIKRVRTDKSVTDVDTMEKVEHIFSSQKLKVE